MPVHIRHLTVLSAAVGAVVIASTGALYVAEAGHPHATGIWKSAVPRGSMHGEFHNYDPVGLMSGKLIKVDCSMNWTNPDDGKLYCFSTGTSLNYFLEWPRKHIKKAREFWERHADPKQPMN